MGFKEGLQYGGGGAAAGAAIGGPWGAAIGGGLGLLGGLFDNREADAEEEARRANRQLQGQFAAAADKYAAYRAQSPESRMAALRNRLSAYQGVQETLSNIYPGTRRVDINKLLQPIPLPRFGGPQPMPAPQQMPVPAGFAGWDMRSALEGPGPFGGHEDVGKIRGGGTLPVPPLMTTVAPRPNPRWGSSAVVRREY